jgi:hypothetical protein
MIWKLWKSCEIYGIKYTKINLFLTTEILVMYCNVSLLCLISEAFRVRDKDLKGIITIGFEDFLGVALSCSV